MFPGAVLILLFVALAVPAFFILTWMISSYNRLLTLRKAYTHAYAQLAALLKQRNDLILNLVEMAKAYINHDPGTTEAVAAARNSASAANLRAAQVPGESAAMQELSGCETELTAALGRLVVAIEADAELRNEQTMIALRAELISTNQKLGSTWQAYNEAVMRYNVVRAGFPNNVLALPLGFTPAESLGSQPARKLETATRAA